MAKDHSSTASTGVHVENAISQGLALVYGFGMLGWSAFTQINSNYWSYFLTEICGLAPAAMGGVRAFVGVASWVFGFIIAIIIERVWLRHGQYRSWLLYAPALSFAAYFFTFVDPAFLDPAGKIVWMSTFYLIGNFMSGFFMIAATSLVPKISKTEQDRALMSQRKAQGNMLVKVLFAMVSLPTILFINSVAYGIPAGENSQNAGPLGFTILTAIVGIFMICMFLMLFKKIDGMDPTQPICEARYAAKKAGQKVPPIPRSERNNVVEMIKYWITNVPALVGLFSECVRFICQTVIMSMSLYIFTYAFDNVAMTAFALTAANVSGLVATFVVEPLSKKIGIRSSYLTGIAIASLSMFAGWLFGAGNMTVFIVALCGCYFGMNFMNGVMIGMQSNAIAYGEWRDGKTSAPFIMSTFLWPPKVAQIVAGSLTGFGLAAIGFVSGMQATPEIAQGMINIICLIPAVGFAISFILFFFGYRLTTEKMAAIAADLQERRIEKAEAAATQGEAAE